MVNLERRKLLQTALRMSTAGALLPLVTLPGARALALEDLLIDVQVQAPERIRQGDDIGVDIAISGADSYAGRDLTLRYFMLDQTQPFPLNAKNGFYDHLISLGQRNDFHVDENTGRLQGVFRYDRSINEPYVNGTALINPLAHDGTSGNFKFLVEVWDGDVLLDREWYGGESSSVGVLHFDNAQNRNVFVYKQLFNRHECDEEALDTATHMIYHFFEFGRNSRGHPVLNTRENLSVSDRTALLERAHDQGVKVLSMITAFGAPDIQSLFENPRTSIGAITDRLQSEGYDGILMDLESIRMRTSDSVALVEFMTALRRAIPVGEKELGIAVSPRYNGSVADGFLHHGFYDFSELAEQVDWLQIMAYDFTTRCAPNLPEDKLRLVAQYAREHVAVEKAVMLMPLYGNTWVFNDATGRCSGDARTLNSRSAARHISEGALSRLDNGELRIEYNVLDDAEGSINRCAYVQTPDVWARRLAIVDEYGLTNVGAWRQTQGTPEIFDVIRTWREA